MCFVCCIMPPRMLWSKHIAQPVALLQEMDSIWKTNCEVNIINPHQPLLTIMNPYQSLLTNNHHEGTTKQQEDNDNAPTQKLPRRAGRLLAIAPAQLVQWMSTQEYEIKGPPTINASPLEQPRFGHNICLHKHWSTLRINHFIKPTINHQVNSYTEIIPTERPTVGPRWTCHHLPGAPSPSAMSRPLRVWAPPEPPAAPSPRRCSRWNPWDRSRCDPCGQPWRRRQRQQIPTSWW